MNPHQCNVSCLYALVTMLSCTMLSLGSTRKYCWSLWWVETSNHPIRLHSPDLGESTQISGIKTYFNLGVLSRSTELSVPFRILLKIWSMAQDSTSSLLSMNYMYNNITVTAPMMIIWSVYHVCIALGIKTKCETGRNGWGIYCGNLGGKVTWDIKFFTWRHCLLHTYLPDFAVSWI